MTKKEVTTVLMYGSSHLIPLPGWPNGITKFQAFLAIKPLLKNRLYWYALQLAYTASDNLFDYKADVFKAFSADHTERDHLMNARERNYLNRLPDEITIYRGMTKSELDSGNFGISWTLNRERAEFFAKTYARNYATDKYEKVVHALTIKKQDVIAYFAGRKEFEIIYLNKGYIVRPGLKFN